MIMICEDLRWFRFATIYNGFHLYHFFIFFLFYIFLVYDLKIVMMQKNTKEEDKRSPFDLI